MTIRPKERSLQTEQWRQYKLFNVFVSSEGLSVVITYYKNFYKGQMTRG
jgi:hypothetical protein